MKKIIIAMLLVSLCAPAFAGKTYTPTQLDRMVSSGQYPEQEPDNNPQATSIPFSACKSAVENLMSHLRKAFPVKTLDDTRDIYRVKAWGYDSVTTASCFAESQEMVITRSAYR